MKQYLENEAFISYVWQYKQYKPELLYTTNNEKIIVKSPGLKNTNAGPDFLNARLLINNTEWVGNVEIHGKASDWNQHKHQHDQAYNNVVLHVVGTNDLVVYTQSGRTMANCILPVNQTIIDNYHILVNTQSWIACEKHIHKVDEFLLNIWIEKLLVERMESRSENLREILSRNTYNWSETMYESLSAGMGTSVNRMPFQMLARCTPLAVLAKHKNSLFQLEALLFGQAGFLAIEPEDAYIIKLQNEYAFLRQKYKLEPMERQIWKTFRLRPGNFPWLRIAQLAALMHEQSQLFSKFLETESLADFYGYFEVKLSAYWDEHYKLGKKSPRKVKKMGKMLVDTLLINAIIPIIFEFGQYKNQDMLKNRALQLLEQLPAEKNAVVGKWQDLGIRVDNARTSQALLHLKKNYCSFLRCLSCSIGDKLIRTQEML